MTPRALMIHRCESGTTGEEVKAAEAKTGCGYHFFIRLDGKRDQLYGVTEQVWHALKWSHHCIGIAVYGDFDPDDKSTHMIPTTAQLAALTNLCLELYHRFGPLPIFGHTDLPGATRYPLKRCPGPYLDLNKLRTEVFTRYTAIA